MTKFKLTLYFGCHTLELNNVTRFFPCEHNFIVQNEKDHSFIINEISKIVIDKE